MSRYFRVTVREIPNTYVKRINYRHTYEVCADNATEATQIALDMFGDYSKVLPGECVEFDPGYPVETAHVLDMADE